MGEPGGQQHVVGLAPGGWTMQTNEDKQEELGHFSQVGDNSRQPGNHTPAGKERGRMKQDRVSSWRDLTRGLTTQQKTNCNCSWSYQLSAAGLGTHRDECQVTYSYHCYY